MLLQKYCRQSSRASAIDGDEVCKTRQNKKGGEEENADNNTQAQAPKIQIHTRCGPLFPVCLLPLVMEGEVIKKTMFFTPNTPNETTLNGSRRDGGPRRT